jgi:subtilase family serine protease
VFVDGGPSTSDDSISVGADVEVNLDQESILSTAPSANQHAYFAPNSDSGFNDVFASVLDDVLGTSHATAPDPHIVALSSSWGSCESGTSPQSLRALDPILKSLVAAGVTVFSASGDDGIYDCRSGDSTPDVDYPGSSPSVISVGGTNLSAAAGTAPNTGANWLEKAWSCTSAFTCQNPAGTGGTGGGASAVFAAPTYQQVGIDDAPFKGSPRRLVPDIAADGDPQTGFDIYSSNPTIGGSATVGGTSLAAPISAAQLANALGDAGRTTGVGDIHGALYSAYHQTRSLAATDPLRPFRDVTAGTNGATANKGSNPSVSAQAGYDTNSGVGGVLWKALVPYLLNAHKPTVAASLTVPRPHSSSYRKITATWHVNRGADTNLLAPTAVKLTANGTTIASSSSLVASGTKTFTVSPGKTYVLTVTGADIAGRKTVVTKSVIVPIDDSAFTFSANWHRVKNASDIAGSHARTAKRGATAKVTGTGRVFTLRVLTGKTSGKLGVYLAGKLVTRLNLHASKAGRKTITLASTAGRHKRTYTFKAMRNATVSIDALTITY